MEQQKLEERVEEIFEQQGFDVSRTETGFEAVKDCDRKAIQVFSSEEYTVEDVKQEAGDEQLVFVDEGLEELAQQLDVSVIREERESEEYELPSYELIGDIAVINELTVDEEEAVSGILEHHPHVETILLKQEPLEGEFRVGGYEKLYGDETETIHKEFGCRYRVDPTKAYFSERLATERKRVADLVEDGEHVLVLGAGVGPYPVLIARKSGAEKVVAVEKNPEAVRYLEENIELNGVADRVEAVEGDARELDREEKFDRVIIATPEFGERFLETAIGHLRDGGILHYYCFEEEGERTCGEDIEELDRELEVIDRTVCGQRGPSVDRVCLDIKIK